MDAERKAREHQWKQNDIHTDKMELAWTNATELQYSQKQTFAEKSLK